jgi:hypothetical protein
VNLTALLARFSKACRSRVTSPRNHKGTPSGSISTTRPLPCAVSRMIEATLSITAERWKLADSSSMRPASILDRSRMSLMIDSRWRLATSIFCSRSVCSGGKVPACIRWLRPRMALSGVRISCDMLARKALFARLADSADSLACWISNSACLRAEMSVMNSISRSGSPALPGR